ncbi:TonB-dependent receptor [Robertkochia aurantiaca]|uniref:TonB-dependent receptor n=1 Tax=Robertkochia aurantiaca TaxID=2873700 RepID=UPI001CCF1EAB|nr:TonB-dependent receptor [Robertkochia sp. 3YJGBD-33]
MKRFLAAFAILLFLKGYGQTLRVLDSESGYPVVNATVSSYDNQLYAVTDFNGNADVSEFSSDQTLLISHIAYRSYTTDINTLRAQDFKVFLKPLSNELDAVVVSASRWKQEKQDIVQRIAQIDREEILLSSPQTSADLLSRSGQVYVQKSQLSGGSPMIRGFSTSRLLLAVDGVRMNNAIFRSGNIQNVISIDPLSVANTEVLFGPGSVIYGSDAIGGVMSFSFLEPKLAQGDDTAFSGNAYSRFSTVNNELTLHADVNLGNKKWAYLGSWTYSDYGDLKMGSNGPEEYLRPEYVVTVNGNDRVVENEDPELQVPTGFEQFSTLNKLLYKPSENWDYKATLYYSATGDNPRYDRLIRYRGDQLRSAEWYYGPQRWLLGSLQLSHHQNNFWYNEMRFTQAYQRYEESRNDRDFGEVERFTTEEALDVYSSNLDMERILSSKGKLFYGLEYIFNKVHSEGYVTDIDSGEQLPTASRYPDGASWQSLAAYSNLEYKPSRRLTLVGGVRYNHFWVGADFSENNQYYDFPFVTSDISTGAVTGSAGLNWQPNRLLRWRLNLSSGFRAPNVDDIGKVFDSEPGSVVVPNPDLDPEYAYNTDLDVQLNFNNKLVVQMAVFYTYLEDAMVRRDYSLDGREFIEYNGELSRIQAIQNAARARIYGFEANLDLRITNALNLTSALSLSRGTEEQDDGTQAPLRHAPPLFGSTHLIWKKGKVLMDMYADYNGSIDFEDLAPSERSKPFIYATDENGNPYSPSWYTLNVRGRYRFDFPLSLNAGLENLTDQRYRTYSSGIVAPGFNFYLALNYSF